MKWGVPKLLLRAREFLRELAVWWWGELREIGHAMLRQLPSRQSPQTFVRVGATSMSIERRESGEWRVVGTVPANAEGTWPAELPGLPPELAGSRTAIVLAESELFFCNFELPTATERHLTSVLRLQLERALPLPLDHVFFDRQVIERDRQRDSFTVRAVVAHRERIEFLREVANRWGLVPVAAGLAGADGTLTCNFLVRRRDPLRWQPTKQDYWLMRAAAACVAALALVVGVQWIRERSVVGEQSAELRAQAERISAQRKELIRQAKPLLALQSIADTRDAPAVLAALSAAVPTSAWFNQIEVVTHVDRAGRIRLMGSVNSRAEVIAAVQAVPGVNNLKATSAFNGQILGPETVELVADFNAGAAPL